MITFRNSPLTVRFKTLILCGLLSATALAAGTAQAQSANAVPDSAGVPAPDATSNAALAPAPTIAGEIAFSADTLTYDSDAEVVTADGNVRMTRDGARLRADKITWNRATGEVTASGQVAVTSANGDTAFGDTVTLTDTLRDGIVENLLLVLADGGRLVARHGERSNGITTLTDAAYTACSVVDSSGCPKSPVWKLSAVRVVHNPDKHRIYYKGARLSLFGAPLLWLPGLSHPDGSGNPGSGLLVPDMRYSRANGIETALPYYISIAPNRDLTLTPHIFTEVMPGFEARYRALTSNGAYSIGGMITRSGRLPAGSTGLSSQHDTRGYIDITGRFQINPLWTISGSALRTTDKTFLRRYDISDADRLRSSLRAERIDNNSYLSISGWAAQTLRAADDQRFQPIALPAIDYRRLFADPLLGGRFQLQANSLALLRTVGQDTQRAFTSLRWDLRTRNRLGQEIQLTLYGRGDVYHTDETLTSGTASYRGRVGWNSRGIGAAAVDLRWPFIGALFNGTQRLTPRIQLASSLPTANMKIPNEDARSIDLEDSNLFALNRFPGYDRWDDSSRITYGFEWAYEQPDLALETVLGQSYRFSQRQAIQLSGTGLSDRFSDIVGRTTVRWRDFIALTHRFRLDKDSGAIRRNEINATIGGRSTYVTASYLRLNRNIDTAVEDLRDREELQFAARVRFARFWSLFGSTVVDLTDKREDPLVTADGYEPVRHRLELVYEDDCVQLGVSWRHDYERAGDARRGNSYRLRLALKNLGR